MSVSMSFTISATTAAELSRGIRELAEIIGDAPVTIDAQPVETPSPALPAPSLPLDANGVRPEPAPDHGITKETVRAKLAALMQDGKDVQPILEAFGAKRLSEIPPTKYPEVMRKAEELA